MKRARRLLMGAAAAALLASAGTALADDAPGKGITIYMQMGGNAGRRRHPGAPDRRVGGGRPRWASTSSTPNSPPGRRRP